MNPQRAQHRAPGHHARILLMVLVVILGMPITATPITATAAEQNSEKFAEAKAYARSLNTESSTAGDTVSATVAFAPEQRAAVIGSLEEIGQVSNTDPLFNAVTVSVDKQDAEKAVESVEKTASSFIFDEALPSAPPTVDRAAQTRANSTEYCNPNTDPQSPLKYTEAWSRFGMTGKDVTVGIISDSFSAKGNQAVINDQAAGYLPGRWNPCGKEAEVVEVIPATTGSDEGRAMAHFVHAIAPDATLYFAASGSSELSLANSIIALVRQGADIIVDDIGIFYSPQFQQGYVDFAYSYAKDHGVMGFTSAGNNNQFADYKQPTTAAEYMAATPVNGFDAASYIPGPCPSWVKGAKDCHQFSTTSGTFPYATMVMKMQEHDRDADMYYSRFETANRPGHENDRFELRYYDHTNHNFVSEVHDQNLGGSRLGYTNINGATAGDTYHLDAVFVRVSGTDTPPFHLLFSMQSYMSIKSIDLVADNQTSWLGYSARGQGTSGNVVQVGAIHRNQYFKEIIPASFSSLAFRRYYRSTINLYDTSAGQQYYYNPATHYGPDVYGIDGITTGMDSFNPFYGTSAAAPSMAAIAALGRQKATRLSNDTFVNYSRSVGTALAVPSTANFMTAPALLGAIASDVATPAAPKVTATVDHTTVTLNWNFDPVASYHRVEFVGEDGRTQEFTGSSGVLRDLEPLQTYTVRVLAGSAIGNESAATTLSFNTGLGFEPNPAKAFRIRERIITVNYGYEVALDADYLKKLASGDSIDGLQGQPVWIRMVDKDGSPTSEVLAYSLPLGDYSREEDDTARGSSGSSKTENLMVLLVSAILLGVIGLLGKALSDLINPLLPPML
ncbi:MAG: S8 family serine peptidase [Corynebacterium sp.]|nr:S8 family serine peptidase [Corynebacterium sp.]